MEISIVRKTCRTREIVRVSVKGEKECYLMCSAQFQDKVEGASGNHVITLASRTPSLLKNDSLLNQNINVETFSPSELLLAKPSCDF